MIFIPIEICIPLVSLSSVFSTKHPCKKISDVVGEGGSESSRKGIKLKMAPCYKFMLRLFTKVFQKLSPFIGGFCCTKGSSTESFDLIPKKSVSLSLQSFDKLSLILV